MPLHIRCFLIVGLFYPATAAKMAARALVKALERRAYASVWGRGIRAFRSTLRPIHHTRTSPPLPLLHANAAVRGSTLSDKM